MELYLKITAGLLLFVQAFHLASFQTSTDSPGRTIDKSWLRELPKNTAGSPNGAEDASTMDSSSGIASGYTEKYNEDEQNSFDLDKDANKTSDDLTVITTILTTNATTKQPEFLTTTTTFLTNSSQINMTKAMDESLNSPTTPQTSTTYLIAKNSTGFSNRTDLQSTTLAPKSNATQQLTTKSQKDTALINGTGSNSTTTVTNTMAPETSTASSSTTVFPSESTETSTVTMTTTAVNTPVKANKTDKDAALGSSSERGLASEPHKNKRNIAWAAVLGTAVAVTCVGLVAYIILKNRRDKGFFHRKLVEEYPSDPVLRLDNSEPLDLNFGGSAYYNPGLQGDNIQMTNFPGRR